MSIIRPVVGGAGLLAGVLVGAQAWRLARALTMADDHAAYWRRRRRSPGDVLLVALGDSLAQGMGSVRPERSWAGRLADEVAVRRSATVRVVNLSVTGASLADVLEAQLPTMPAAAGDPSSVVAVAVGTNDAAGTDPEVFRARFAALCAALPAGALVADVPDLQRDPVRPLGARLAAIARDVLADHPDLRPVALEAATRRLRIWEVGPDLAHPSGLGYRRYGRAFAAALPLSAASAGILDR